MYGEKVSFKKLQTIKNTRIYIVEDSEIPWIKTDRKKRKKKIYEHGYHSAQDQEWVVEVNPDEEEEEVEMEEDEDEGEDESSEEEKEDEE